MMLSAHDHNREDRRGASRWTHGHVAFYAVVLAVLLGFVASREQAMRWIADGVTAEYIGADRQDGADPVLMARAAESRKPSAR